MKDVMVVWRGWYSALVSINEVNLRRARLELGSATMSGFNSRCGTFIWYVSSHPCQLSLVIPMWVGAIECQRKGSGSLPLGVKAGMVRVWVAGKTV